MRPGGKADDVRGPVEDGLERLDDIGLVQRTTLLENARDPYLRPGSHGPHDAGDKRSVTAVREDGGPLVHLEIAFAFDAVQPRVHGRRVRHQPRVHHGDPDAAAIAA